MYKEAGIDISEDNNSISESNSHGLTPRQKQSPKLKQIITETPNNIKLPTLRKSQSPQLWEEEMASKLDLRVVEDIIRHKNNSIKEITRELGKQRTPSAQKNFMLFCKLNMGVPKHLNQILKRKNYELSGGKESPMGTSSVPEITGRGSFQQSHRERINNYGKWYLNPKDFYRKVKLIDIKNKQENIY